MKRVFWLMKCACSVFLWHILHGKQYFLESLLIYKKEEQTEEQSLRIKDTLECCVWRQCCNILSTKCSSCIYRKEAIKAHRWTWVSDVYNANILVAVKHCPAVSSKLSIQFSRKPNGPRLLHKFGDIWKKWCVQLDRQVLHGNRSY